MAVKKLPRKLCSLHHGATNIGVTAWRLAYAQQLRSGV